MHSGNSADFCTLFVHGEAKSLMHTANCSIINNRGYDLASKLRDYLPYYILIQNTTHISYEISLPLRKNGVSEQTFEHTFTKMY